jgi:hypothetical protein
MQFGYRIVISSSPGQSKPSGLSLGADDENFSQCQQLASAIGSEFSMPAVDFGRRQRVKSLKKH